MAIIRKKVDLHPYKVYPVRREEDNQSLCLIGTD